MKSQKLIGSLFCEALLEGTKKEPAPFEVGMAENKRPGTFA